MRLKKIVIPVVILAVLAGAIWWRMHTSGSDDGPLVLSGNIETTEVAVSFKLAGRVAERLVDEGETVTAAQTVARLEDDDFRLAVTQRRAEVRQAEARVAELEAGSRPEEIAQADAALDQIKAQLSELEAGTRKEVISQAESNVRRAEAALDELRNGSRPEEIRTAEAELARAKAENARASQDYIRAQTLFQEKVIPPETFEARKAAAKVAEAALAKAEATLALVREGPRKEAIAQAEAALAQARAELDEARNGPRKETIARVRAEVAKAAAAAELIHRGPRQETIDQAHAALDAARESLKLAEVRLGYATLCSPISGVVLSKAVEAGEFVNPGTPVITVGDLDHVWLRAYINMPDLDRIRLGTRARIRTDTTSDHPLEGRVSFISEQAEFTPKSIQTQSERVKLVYRVKIDIENVDHVLKPGMPADAVFDVTGE